MKNHFLAFISVVFLLQACQSTNVPSTSETQLQIREFQTRSYDTKNSDSVLKVALNVLQDEGFIVKSADSKLGYLTGSKDVDSGDRSPIFGRSIQKNPIFIVIKTYLDIYLLPFTIWGKMQDKPNIKTESIEATINVTSFGDKTRVRANFQRKAIDASGQVQAIGQIKDVSFYQAFFSKVDKGIFISRENL